MTSGGTGLEPARGGHATAGQSLPFLARHPPRDFRHSSPEIAQPGLGFAVRRPPF
jgi:hypothetical protein